MSNTLIKILIRSNIFVAICAASLSWQSILVCGYPIYRIKETIVVFLGTWFVYNMHRYLKKGIEAPKILGFNGHLIFMMISGIFMIPVLFYLERSALVIFAVCALITITYSINVVRIKGKWRNLRQGYLKPISVVLMWTVLTVIFPLSDNFTMSTDQLILLTERFLFLMAITLPFDIRDISIDEIQGIRTVPLMIGWKKTINLSLIFVLLFAISVFVALFSKSQNPSVSLAYFGSAIITLIAVVKTNPNRHALHYSFTLEGLSLIQTLIVAGLVISGLRI